MEIKIDPYNEILFEFESAMDALEQSYARLRGDFDVGSFHYLRLKRKGLDEEKLRPLLQKLGRMHSGLRMHAVNLQHVFDEHRQLTLLMERRIKQREEAGGSP